MRVRSPPSALMGRRLVGRTLGSDPSDGGSTPPAPAIGSEVMAPSASGQATRLSIWERRVRFPPALLDRCGGEAPRMRRKHETVGSSPTALTRTRSVSHFMAADDQWPISGL